MTPMEEDRRATLEALGIDLESSLVQEARFLHDVPLLGALHGELEEALGPTEAASVLRQLGFVHGLRDAWRVARGGGLDALGPGTPPPVPTQLPMVLRPAAGGGLSGDWPERREAEARARALGQCDEPGCHASAGYTSGWLSGLFGTRMVAVERTCGSAGHDACRFDVREASEWRECGDAAAADALAALPFESLQKLVQAQMAREPAPAHEPGIEAGSAAIHVWGPVMVMPFAGPDESLRALQMIAVDRDARGVRVVVIDLSGAIIDDGFGAVALERVLEAVSHWGAEPILAGISPLSMAVVEGLEQSHLLIHKDLPEAIATAFQIADAQRDAV